MADYLHDDTKLEVTQDEISEAAIRIQIKWRRIGNNLGPEPKFKSYELHEFGEEKNDRDRAQKMLEAWAEKHHTKATREHLIKAMRKEGYGEQISEVFKASSAQPTPIKVTSDGWPETDFTTYERKVGKVLIVNNYEFKNPQEVRSGSKEDGDRLVDVFCKYLKFEKSTSQPQIQIVNQTKDQIEEAVKLFVQEDFTGYSCSVFILMSHGKESEFLDVNREEIKIISILNLFRTSENLRGKPKLFFFQACRGKEHAGAPPVASDSDSPPPVESDMISIRSMPNSADFFIGYSSSSGDQSFRFTDPDSKDYGYGSWYMLHLVEAIKKYYKILDVAEIHYMVNHMVSKDRGSLAKAIVMQAPQFVCSLRGKFYLSNCSPQ